MIASIVRVVLVPVALGVAANRLLGARLEPVKRVFPLVSVAAIVVIIAIVVAVSADSIGELSGLLFAAVALHNGCGLLAGYALPRLFGCDETRSRTLAIEVGMQNSGLAVALSVQYFSSLAALPGALFSIWHNLTGSALAGWWSRSAARPQPGD